MTIDAIGAQARSNARGHSGMNSKVAAERRERLRQIIARRSFSTGKTMQLASGRTSNYYFDLKPTMLDHEGIDLLADVVRQCFYLNAKYIRRSCDGCPTCCDCGDPKKP